MNDLNDLAKQFKGFENGSLTKRISLFESSLIGKNCESSSGFLEENKISENLLVSALFFKQQFGQIDVLIHSVGILLALPKILSKGETIQSLSLGAGNTGRHFDLETNQRVAEFKFIVWKGGAEAIRQNTIFADFYWLAENDTSKRKELFLLGLDIPLKFFNGGRAINSVLSKNQTLRDSFRKKYNQRFGRVNEYYQYKKSCVTLIDLYQILSIK
jgi:hypothetical protein